jgi:hypothetical protein
MIPQNRFDKLLKTAKPAAQSPPPPNIQTSEHSDTSIQKAKSSSKDFKRTTLYLTQELHRKLKRASLEHDMEMSDIAEAAITQWLEEHRTDQE